MASLNPLSGALGHRRAAHLLRRASFRYTKQRIDELAAMTAADAVAALLTLHPLQLDQPVYGAGAVTWINPPGGTDPADDDELQRYIMGWWLNEALNDPGIGHKMSFFFHQYMVVQIGTLRNANYFDYLGLMRWGALGNFKQLATKLALDNCMLRYLNNDQNFKDNPNENFAREFFELFTIGTGEAAGPGDYTKYREDDISEAARAFTGFNRTVRGQTIDPDTQLPAGRGIPGQHDFDPKTFSNRFGNVTLASGGDSETDMLNELNAFVDMVFAQEETARNFCRRLHRYFVTRPITDEIENEVIAQLAQTFRSNNFEIKPVLQSLLASEHFFDADDDDPADESLGALIRPPLELALHSISFFDVPVPDPMSANADHYLAFWNGGVINRMLGQAGLELFFPPDVAGYPGYFQVPIHNRMWFNSATIIARYKLPQMLLTGTQVLGGSSESIGTQVNVAAWMRDSNVVSDPSDSYILVKELLKYLFPEEPDNDRFAYFHDTIFLDQLPTADWTYEWQNFVGSGNDSEVKIPLQRLVNALMYAPEYQTC